MADSFEFGEALAGIGWPHVANMEYAAGIVKAHGQDAIELFRAGSDAEVSLTKNPEPDFDSLTKSYLTQDEVRAAARSAVYRFPHEPTPAQINAGNYKKRRVAWRGLTISIENDAGFVRRGTDRDGHAWEKRMDSPYGFNY